MVGQLLKNGLGAWLTCGVALEAGSNEAVLWCAPGKDLPSKDMRGSMEVNALSRQYED